AEFGIRKNPDSLKIAQAFAEPAIRDAKHSDRFQFVRNGYFCLDSKEGTSDNLIFNRIVSLRSSYKPE
ncbi:MAG: glutamine--tRNA ligase, partial [Clostridiales bacterium]|nr:glutamine--tRNA ligase [Clostridiales bacterium]